MGSFDNRGDLKHGYHFTLRSVLQLTSLGAQYGYYLFQSRLGLDYSTVEPGKCGLILLIAEFG